MIPEIEKLAFPLGHLRPPLSTRIRYWFIMKLSGKDLIILNARIAGEIDARNYPSMLIANNIIEWRENKECGIIKE